MTGLRVHTVLDATLPAAIALPSQTRLWVVAMGDVLAGAR
ncbi:hypothetical protein AMIS_19940 [Actinoplanes missouriensis 431]|uniref:Uncharacterized protein n=1 Tax=Actinoplanes missouriensis (strain ATCC 14538 / DSM 43046 / CBS 188.64 / JCM 3121 / NBRC 102363 / NCIMB 12654 / NRRL B-3342 / UNCC 431) TaxID=512565 RepID=I0H2H7_ACTM4|nr:hypothetical protein AMIS_19940 [Actinoplanes missouriensis 431]